MIILICFTLNPWYYVNVTILWEGKRMKDHSLLLDLRALVLKPVFSSKYRSKIITTHGIYYSESKPIDLLNKACLRFFSTKEGRKNATRELFKFPYNPPFLISKKVGVFPTMSSKHPECIWIFNHPFHAEKVEQGTKLTFTEHDIHTIVPTSLHTITVQNYKLHTVVSHSQQSRCECSHTELFSAQSIANEADGLMLSTNIQ